MRAPKLFAAFLHDGQYYIVMEFIDGKQYNILQWNALPLATQDKISASYREQLEQLRAIPGENYYGRIDHQGFNATFGLLLLGPLLMDKGCICGPYYKFEDLKAAMIRAMQVGVAMTLPDKPDWADEQKTLLVRFEEVLERTTGLEPTLTHLDPGLQNMIIKETEEGDMEVTLIDWEFFGWLPAFLHSVVLHEGCEFYHDQRNEPVPFGYVDVQECFSDVFDRTCYQLL